MISWAGRGEDVLLDRLFKLQSPAKYVDIGCARPREGSVTYHLYKLGWRGLTIDLRPELQKEWRKIRPKDSHKTFAVSAESKKMGLKNQGFRTQLVPPSSSEKFIRTTNVATLIKIYNNEFDSLPKLIKLDIEGLEYEVIKEMLKLHFEAEIFIVEVVDQIGSNFFIRKESIKIKSLMKKNGYVLVLNDGVNLWFVKALSKLINKTVWAPAYPGVEKFIPYNMTFKNRIKNKILLIFPFVYQMFYVKNLISKKRHQ
jgi:hypothetical protein